MAFVNFNVTPEEGSLFGERESEEDKGLHAAFVILVSFGKCNDQLTSDKTPR